MSGLAFARRIIGGRAGKGTLRSLKLKGRTLHANREPGEICFAIHICAGLEIQFVEAAEAISNVNLNDGRVHRLAVAGCDCELH